MPPQEIDCHLLHSVLATADEALLAELRHGAVPPDATAAATAASGLNLTAAEVESAGTAAAADMSAYLEAAGLSRPKEQVIT